MSGNGHEVDVAPLTKADFSSDQETRWCPGCGDYAVLASVQSFMPELGIPPDKIVFVTGIGCAGRFVYYMDTYGMHGIHGRAPALATGVATSRPDLSVWVVSGDGDALSIGGNHLIHALRRNVPLKILRAEYLVDCESYTKVDGLPIFTRDVIEEILARVGGSSNGGGS